MDCPVCGLMNDWAKGHDGLLNLLDLETNQLAGTWVKEKKTVRKKVTFQSFLILDLSDRTATPSFTYTNISTSQREAASTFIWPSITGIYRDPGNWAETDC